MTFTQIIETFTYYGADVTLLAALTGILTQLIKKFFFKDGCKKTVTFIPFVLGIVLYCIYGMAVKMDWSYPINSWASVLEHGISIGSVATVIYVMYEQFVRGGGLTPAEAVVTRLVSGYVTEGSEQETAKLVAYTIEHDITGDCTRQTEEILTEKKREDVTENEISVISRLIVETLARMK